MPIAKFTFGGMNNVADPASIGKSDPSVRGTRYDVCADIADFDVRRANDLTTRQGSILVTTGAVTSSWGNGDRAFCVIDGQIHRFNGTTLIPLSGCPALAPMVEFAQVNTVTLFSDNTTIGVIDEAFNLTVLNNPVEEEELLDLETWVKQNYPADDSNMQIDAFKITTYAGRCLEFNSGTTYLAVDNFVFRTRTFDAEHMDARYNVVAGCAKPITMIKAVEDKQEGGLFIGTEDEVIYVEPGVNGEGMTQTQVLLTGALYGSALTVHAGLIPALGASGQAAVWLTPQGVYAGAAGGKVVNLTEGVRSPEGDRCAALVRAKDKIFHYLVCPNTADGCFEGAGEAATPSSFISEGEPILWG